MHLIDIILHFIDILYDKHLFIKQLTSYMKVKKIFKCKVIKLFIN